MQVKLHSITSVWLKKSNSPFCPLRSIIGFGVLPVSKVTNILRIEAGQIGIVGGTHDITTGEVTFYQHTLIINNPK